MLVTKYDTSGTWQELNRIRLWNGVMCILYCIVPVNFSSRFWSFYIRKLAFVNHWGIHSGCLFWLKDKLCHSSFSDEIHDPNPQNQTNYNRRGLPWKQFFHWPLIWISYWLKYWVQKWPPYNKERPQVKLAECLWIRNV